METVSNDANASADPEEYLYMVGAAALCFVVRYSLDRVVFQVAKWPVACALRYLVVVGLFSTEGS